MAGIIVGLLNDESKETVLSSMYSPVNNYFDNEPLCDEIKEVASGSFKTKQPPEIKGTGFVVKSLEAALWAFYNADNFREGALKVVNLGDDADTTGAVYGQIAGSFYNIPQDWIDIITMKNKIMDITHKLISVLK
jgi:ADP-ribosylglycohydrolase